MVIRNANLILKNMTKIEETIRKIQRRKEEVTKNKSAKIKKGRLKKAA